MNVMTVIDRCLVRRLVRWTGTAVLTSALAVASCRGCPGAAEDAEDAEDAEKDTARGVASVTTAVVQRADLEERVAAYGVLEPAPNDELPINLDVESSVVRVLAKDGQPVQAGEPLVEVRTSGAARLDAERARIDVQLAADDLARRQTMLAGGMATNADVAQQAAALERAKAEAALFPAGGRAHVIRAPSAGLVRSVVVKPGDVVAPGGPLLLLAGSGARRVRLGIEPADVARIRSGARVRLSPVYAPGTVVDATISQVHPHVDADTHQAGAIAVIAALPLDPPMSGSTRGAPSAAAAFVDGALCRGDVVVREARAALVVPRASVVTRGDDSWVFVVRGATANATADTGAARADDAARAAHAAHAVDADPTRAHAVRVLVRVVLDDGARVAIESVEPTEATAALREGAQVVVTGVSELESDMAIKVDNNADRADRADHIDHVDQDDHDAGAP